MQDKTILSCVAIIAIMLLEFGCLLTGIDGVVFSAVVAIIAGIAGYQIKNIVKFTATKKEEEKKK